MAIIGNIPYFQTNPYSILSKIQVVQTGRFLRENIGSEQKITSGNLPRLRGGLLETRVVLPEKHRLRANVRICAYFLSLLVLSSSL